MVAVVLDASALLRFLLGETGGERIKELLKSAFNAKASLFISAVNWGEVVGKVYTAHGKAKAEALEGTFAYYGLQIVPVDARRSFRAATLKADYQIPYADAFCVELALSLPEHLLVTADFDFKALETHAKIEFLPPKAQPK